MDDLKIVLIGAGSTVFTPGLIADLAASELLRGATVALVDIDPDAVDVMTRLAQRISDERGGDLRIESGTDRRELLSGASFVTTTIAVGGASAWEQDLRIPERQGIYQTVGDSVGPGGVLRAMRHVPELVSIARDMEQLCPDAWLFNYTNPLSVLVRAVHSTSRIKCAGLCHGVLHTRSALGEAMGVDPADVSVVFAGVNHLSWLLDMRINGADVYPAYRALVEEELADDDGARNQDPYAGLQRVSAHLMEVYGLYPSPGDRHVAEFFAHFLRKTADGLPYGLQSGLDLTNDIIAGKKSVWGRLRRQAEGRDRLDPSLLDEAREGERLVDIIEAIAWDRPVQELAVNVANRGAIANLPPEAIVEVPGIVSGHGIQPLGVGPLPAGVASLLTSRIQQQELTVHAALGGDRRLALQALLADPLVPTLEGAKAMLEQALGASAHV